MTNKDISPVFSTSKTTTARPTVPELTNPLHSTPTLSPSVRRTNAQGHPSSRKPRTNELANLSPAKRKKLLDKCLKGFAVYRAPSPMVEGEAKDITVVVSQVGATTKPEATLPAGKAPIQKRESTVCDRMKADLDGENFSVHRTGNTTPERLIGPDANGVWTWSVTPTKAGSLSLQLSLTAIIEGRGGNAVVATFTEQIHVSADRLYEAETLIKTWWPIVGVGIAGAIGGGVTLIRNRRRRLNEAHQEPEDPNQPDEPAQPAQPDQPEIITLPHVTILDVREQTQGGDTRGKRRRGGRYRSSKLSDEDSSHQPAKSVATDENQQPNQPDVGAPPDVDNPFTD